MFWVISVYFNIRNTLPKCCTFLLGHSVYIYIYIYVCVCVCVWDVFVRPLEVSKERGISRWVSEYPSRGSKRFTPESNYQSAWGHSTKLAILFFAELKGL